MIYDRMSVFLTHKFWKQTLVNVLVKSAPQLLFQKGGGAPPWVGEQMSCFPELFFQKQGSNKAISLDPPHPLPPKKKKKNTL